MRSGDLFLEVSSSTQAKSLANLKKLAHLDVHVVAHDSLNSSRGDISSGFLNVSTEEILENMRDQRYVQSGVLLYVGDGQLENTFRIRYVASSANDTVIQRTFVGASQPALVAEKWVTTVMTAAKRTLRKLQRGSACCLITHTSPWCKLCKCCKKKNNPSKLYPNLCRAFQRIGGKNAPPPTKNSPPSTKKSLSINDYFPSTCKEKIISRPPSASPKRPKSRKASKGNEPESTPQKMSNFSKKSHLMDEDMLELHPDDDEDLMDMMPGSSKPSSERGARATQ
ncbi:hypothetical protein TNCV_4627981 [Trichonephila clavipes]|nr:hypothetical protein TNCV_4627981 [Trichonephila clavipes]